MKVKQLSVVRRLNRLQFFKLFVEYFIRQTHKYIEKVDIHVESCFARQHWV